MQRKSVYFIIFLIVFYFPVQTLHGESEIFFGGTVKLFTALFTADDPAAVSVPPHKAGDFSTTRGELRLKLDGYASDNVSFKTQVYFISTADPSYDSLLPSGVERAEILKTVFEALTSLRKIGEIRCGETPIRGNMHGWRGR